MIEENFKDWSMRMVTHTMFMMLMSGLNGIGWECQKCGKNQRLANQWEPCNRCGYKEFKLTDKEGPIDPKNLTDITIEEGKIKFKKKNKTRVEHVLDEDFWEEDICHKKEE